MSAQVEFKGHGGVVLVSVGGYENPGAQTVSDANWLSCCVELTVGGVSASLNASFGTRDFSRFLEQLERILIDLDGVAPFETDEDALALKVALAAKGTGTVSGVLRCVDQARATVEFSFESDQTFLRQAIVELRNLCREFPVKERVP